MSEISITVAHRGVPYALSLLPGTRLSAFHAKLEELTSIPPPLQKLLYKGKKDRGTGADDATTILDAGIKDGMKIQMLGSTAKEIGGLKAVEDERNRREAILRARALKPSVKLRSTQSGNLATSSYTFHAITPLPNLQNITGAREYLTRLAKDPAIISVMQHHKFSVGELTELFYEGPNLLGLCVNAGAQIKLRIRTDANDGFRSYRDVRKVLCHELVHLVHHNHDTEFKELNSLLNREVAQFERATIEGSHTLAGPRGDVYDPDESSYMPTGDTEKEEIAAANAAHTPGGSTHAPADDPAETRRQRVLEATVQRLKMQEESQNNSGNGN